MDGWRIGGLDAEMAGSLKVLALVLFFVVVAYYYSELMFGFSVLGVKIIVVDHRP